MIVEGGLPTSAVSVLRRSTNSVDVVQPSLANAKRFELAFRSRAAIALDNHGRGRGRRRKGSIGLPPRGRIATGSGAGECSNRRGMRPRKGAKTCPTRSRSWEGHRDAISVKKVFGEPFLRLRAVAALGSRCISNDF